MEAKVEQWGLLKWVLAHVFCQLFTPGFSQQLFINEVQSSNVSTLFDFRDETSDWLEIYNAGDQGVNLQGYGLSDVDSLPMKWVFPQMLLPSKSHLLVFASGLDIKEPGLQWETIIDVGDSWHYHVPVSAMPEAWQKPGFDLLDWKSGMSGFGYGDNDDSTQIPATIPCLSARISPFPTRQISDRPICISTTMMASWLISTARKWHGQV
ncbi:MAG: lamin tail domain-containing protein [Cyclobacteriaceae bacterium]|nr:lamin tail domain-containing protein [Cyclobacteriaceae bacterium]